MKKTAFLFVFLTLIFCVPALAEPGAAWPVVTAAKLPRWRGFNLLDKFNQGNARPFNEEDFRLIAQLGFNFVRLPMDYRCWIKDGNWEQFNEAALQEIDQAVELGNKYHLHVCLNFHRAPGYTVAKPAEKMDLFSDPEALRICQLHWATFAKRYKGIPSARLSFNLLNEPKDVKIEQFVAVIRGLVTAIRQEDPDRLIISDGLHWGGQPVLELADLHIAQAGRGYAPMEISHYQASWVKSQNYPPPAWPRAQKYPGTITQPQKAVGNHEIVIQGPLPAAVTLRLHVGRVSGAATFVVEADAVPVFQHAFACGPGAGEWKQAVFVEKYKVYQNVYDRDYTAVLPRGAQCIRLHVTAGDWLSLSELGFRPEGAAGEDVLALEEGFTKKAEPFAYAPGTAKGPFVGLPMYDQAWLWKQGVQPWLDAESQGIGVLIGEWGVYNKTPHAVALTWAENCLDNWKRAGLGWALWNFRGSFGVLDSGRTDVHYEDFQGHKLDRQLLELLEKY